MTQVHIQTMPAQVRTKPLAQFGRLLMKMFNNLSFLFVASISLAFSLLPVPVTAAPFLIGHIKQTLVCTGKLSKLTYDDCQGPLHSNTTACYLNEIAGQYRPCAGVCDNVERGTRDAHKCLTQCAEYMNMSCRWISMRSTTGTPIITTEPSTVEISQSPVRWDTITAIAVSCSLLFLAAVVLVLCFRKRIAKFCNINTRNGKCDFGIREASRGQQPANDQQQANEQGTELLGRPAVQCTDNTNRDRRSNNDGAQPAESIPACMVIRTTVRVDGQTARADLSEIRDFLQNTDEDR